MNNIEDQIKNLLDEAAHGLSKSDIQNASELIDHNELGVAFQLVCEQLYENDFSISSEMLEKISNLAKLLQLDDKSWIFLKNDL